MKKLLLLTLLVIFGMGHKAFAQAELRIDTAKKFKFQFYHPQGISANKNVYVSFFLINTGKSPSDSNFKMTVHMRINTSFVDSFEFLVSKHIKPYKTDSDVYKANAVFTLDSHFVSPKSGAPVVIVIWPTGNGLKATSILPFTDTLKFTYTTIEPANDAASYVKIYPNPAQDVIHLDIQKQGITLKGIELNDMSGRCVINSITQENTLDVGNLPKGIYILNLRFSDGSTGRYKLTRN